MDIALAILIVLTSGRVFCH